MHIRGGVIGERFEGARRWQLRCWRMLVEDLLYAPWRDGGGLSDVAPCRAKLACVPDQCVALSGDGDRVFLRIAPVQADPGESLDAIKEGLLGF
ncbi:MAG: hypothetical protein DLM64_01670 [Solirubrobacterales bacterium]|nr:MAG: hypothetical protein DLM64_01670 [Solirubrobacterales bacterium]